MYFEFLIQCVECLFFSWRCNYQYRKLIEFLCVCDYSFWKLIVLLYTFLHVHPILWVLLAMLQSCDYPIPVNLFNFHCCYLIERNWTTIVPTQYMGLLNTGFARHVSILQLSHTWKSLRLTLWLSRKEKPTYFCINPIHWAFKYIVVVVTSLPSFHLPATSTLYILNN